jgi:hypothetical protein
MVRLSISLAEPGSRQFGATMFRAVG